MKGKYNKRKYLLYIHSGAWLLKRAQFILWKYNRGEKIGCEKCNHKGTKRNWLEVHHKTYIRLFHERMEDLALLCQKCHKKEHGKIERERKKRRYVS